MQGFSRVVYACDVVVHERIICHLYAQQKKKRSERERESHACMKCMRKSAMKLNNLNCEVDVPN